MFHPPALGLYYTSLEFTSVLLTLMLPLLNYLTSRRKYSKLKNIIFLALCTLEKWKNKSKLCSILFTVTSLMQRYCFPGFQKCSFCQFIQHLLLLEVYDYNLLGGAYTTSYRRLLYSESGTCRLVSYEFSSLRDSTRELLLGYDPINPTPSTATKICKCIHYSVGRYWSNQKGANAVEHCGKKGISSLVIRYPPGIKFKAICFQKRNSSINYAYILKLLA